jgi:hypothetical protein
VWLGEVIYFLGHDWSSKLAKELKIVVEEPIALIQVGFCESFQTFERCGIILLFGEISLLLDDRSGAHAGKIGSRGHGLGGLIILFDLV